MRAEFSSASNIQNYMKAKTVSTSKTVEDKIASTNLRNFEGPRVLFTTSSQFGNVILKAIKLTALKSRDQDIDQIDT